jgi:FkbM family methyltransferase
MLTKALSRLRHALEIIYDSTVKRDFIHNVVVTGGRAEIDLGNYLQFQSCRIDIGLSHNAPHSAYWCLHNPESFVIGVEPNRFNAKRILDFGIWSKSHGEIPLRRKKPPNFHLLFCAIDDVEKPSKRDFHLMSGDSGTSSLLRPTNLLTEKFGYQVREVARVETISLNSLMAPLLLHFQTIDVIKIDTQGNDLAVLRSAADCLDKVKIIIVELESYGQYEFAANREEIIDFLESKGFRFSPELLPNQIEDGVFVNLRYTEHVNRFI